MNGNTVPINGTHTSRDIPIKQLHTLQGKTFVVIAESIVNKLNIDNDTFVEQLLVDEGILLRVRRLTIYQNENRK
jgi:hypothetical protein